MTWNSPSHDDPEVRAAVWASVCSAAELLSERCKVYTSKSDADEVQVRAGAATPPDSVPTWRLVQALSLLLTLRNGEAVSTPKVFNILGGTGPIEFLERGERRFLWAQPQLSGGVSAMKGIPDLLVSATRDKPSHETTLRVIECKCDRGLGAPQIRGEYGKAYDLGVSSYLVWSWYATAPKLVQAARTLGLDLEELGFDGPNRQRFLSRPEALLIHMAKTIEQSRNDGRFARVLELRASEIGEKIAKFGP